jgi:hypothetical protein
VIGYFDHLSDEFVGWDYDGTPPVVILDREEESVIDALYEARE